MFLPSGVERKGPRAFADPSCAARLLTLCVLSACGSDEPQNPAPRVVQVMEVRGTDTAQTLGFNGTLRAADRADLAFEVQGEVEAVAVELGDRFERGDVLVTLDTGQARASVEAAASGLREAQAELRNAAADAERHLSLRGSGAVSEQRIDDAVSRHEAAGQRVSRLAAELERARDRLADFSLVAPYDGSVADRLVEPSDVVAPAQSVLEVTGDEAGLEAVASVPERLVGLARPGEAARVRIASSGREMEGRVAEVASSAGQAGLVQVIVSLAERDGLVPGTRVEVLLEDPSVPDGVLLPPGAYATGPDGSATVFVVEGDLVQARRVAVGALTTDGLIATSGLEEGEVIAAKGANRLRDGETVRTVGTGLARYDG